ncbi:glycoside hydrolase family 3 protein [Clostridium folliculivorans]|uniref:beta-glucosidase n=1 Tax=Clostridium folliculivorans TaxID=2886038 RepID=A0A9W6DAR5_9CLOT|nr:glycoside hydrolase family 3 protein [Clostridium folliculivorans]GKU24948.1 beta-glucosidase [Clostridium folliculivorans]GKU31046.1 beta-glucosidase [Clostridium folliculivorans]
MRNWRKIDKGDYVIIVNEGGKNVAYSKNSGIKIIEQDGFAFKNLSKSGRLEKYEDWRLPAKDRAKDLASRLSIKQIAGLMLYSGHQAVFSKKESFSKAFDGTYDGKTFDETDVKITDLTDQQKKFLTDDNLRHVLITAVDDAKTAAVWNNNLQAFVEGLGLGIPVNISSDPRHTTSPNAEFNAGAGGDISKWPEPLGLAATFSSEEVSKFGFIASKEYRSLGIATALSPQVDIATDPRWMRFSGTLGEDPILARDLAEAYCNGFQTSAGDSETEDGWGYESVNAMVKHWPGGGSCESGRDAHFAYGKYAVYPGDNFNDHLIPFTEGAFKLSGKTKKASAVMPYYTISYDIDKKYGENVGNSFSKYIIKDLLREEYNYDGVVCTDWGITKENNVIDGFISGKSWGVEKLSESERHFKVLMAGVDQFGGNNEVLPILEAYDMGVKEFGEEYMRERFEKSAVRLLLNIFRTGLFENPYVDPEESDMIVGKVEYMKAGYECQLKSIVMLKNKNQTLPIKERKNVYIPKRRLKESIDWFGNVIPAREIEPVNKAIVEKYFNVVDNAEEADFSIVFIESPKTVGYSKKEGYVPISLQYRPYKAISSRKVSLAGGDPLEQSNNRSYYGKTNYATNEEDLDIILETKNLMRQKPVLVSINMGNPTVFGEFEDKVDAIVVDFGVQVQAILDVISGKRNPSGLLPFNMPKDMDNVEEQFEDVPHDMKCYKDELGNEYSFAFGLNFNGIINDERVRRYKRI